MDTTDLIQQPRQRFAKTHAHASAMNTRANTARDYAEIAMTIVGGIATATAGVVKLIDLLSPERDENVST